MVAKKINISSGCHQKPLCAYALFNWVLTSKIRNMQYQIWVLCDLTFSFTDITNASKCNRMNGFKKKKTQDTMLP